MATVNTALNMVRDYVPYERPPQPDTLWTAIPRGLQSGIINNGTLDAKPINDDQILTCTLTLPANFGYVMADSALTIDQNRAGDWENWVNVRLLNFYRGANANIQSFSADYRQELQDNRGFLLSASMSIVQPWPTFPIVSPSGTSPIIVVMKAQNIQAAASTAGTVMAFVSFWQFDLEQIRKFPINSPIPTHNR